MSCDTIARIRTLGHFLTLHRIVRNTISSISVIKIKKEVNILGKINWPLLPVHEDMSRHQSHCCESIHLLAI